MGVHPIILARLGRGGNIDYIPVQIHIDPAGCLKVEPTRTFVSPRQI